MGNFDFDQQQKQQQQRMESFFVVVMIVKLTINYFHRCFPILIVCHRVSSQLHTSPRKLSLSSLVCHCVHVRVCMHVWESVWLSVNFIREKCNKSSLWCFNHRFDKNANDEQNPSETGPAEKVNETNRDGEKVKETKQRRKKNEINIYDFWIENFWSCNLRWQPWQQYRKFISFLCYVRFNIMWHSWHTHMWATVCVRSRVHMVISRVFYGTLWSCRICSAEHIFA